MLNTFKKMAVKNLSQNCALLSPIPQPGNLDLDSEAAGLMVDFTKTAAVTVNASVAVNDALEFMRANRIRALMVIGYDGEFAGLVTAMDLMGRKPMAYANEAGIPRVEVLVKHIMLPKNKLKAITLEDVEKATIGDIVQVLKSLNEQHILVVEGDDLDMQIIGIYSASDFKRVLNMPLDTTAVANTFSDLERVINENKEMM